MRRFVDSSTGAPPAVVLLCVAAVVGLEGVSLHAWLPNHGTAPMVGGGGGGLQTTQLRPPTVAVTFYCSYITAVLNR